MYFTTGSGRIHLTLTKAQARIGGHSGECYNDIAFLRTLPAIKTQLNKIDPEILAAELKEYSFLDSSQHEENLLRILWIACGDILDRGAL